MVWLLCARQVVVRALSIRQPWAWLIVHGFKDVEIRSWGTEYRGLFLVHAGLQVDTVGYDWLRRWDGSGCGLSVISRGAGSWVGLGWSTV